MKINKVEISAFRAFDKVEDSTFDFTIDKNITADFISIYAPNGYGKTSFYDAVEWAITGQISRFEKNAPENEKIGKENRKYNKGQYFLQHNGQPKLGYVEVFTDKEKTFFKKNISKSTVYDFSKTPINSYFRDVVLSQDLIDTFIKEEKADERYKKFISNIPFLNDYNTSLQNVIKLAENVDDEISSLKSTLEKQESEQLQFDSIVNSKVLDEINIAISNLIEKKQDLSLVLKNTFDNVELQALNQKIDSNLVSLEMDIETLKLRLENLEMAFNGTSKDDNKPGVVLYYNSKNQHNDLLKKSDNLNSILIALNKKEIAQKNIIEINNNLDEKIKLISEANKIKNQFERFRSIQYNLDDLKRKIEDNNLISDKSKLELRELNSNLSNLKIDVSNLNELLESNLKKLIKIPDFKENILDIDNKIITLSKEISNTELLIQSDENHIQETYNNINIHISYLNRLEYDIGSLLEDDFFKGFEDKIKIIINTKAEIDLLENQLKNINSQIDSQNSLNIELKKLITKGLDIISESKKSDCPLCCTNFKSYEDLSYQIANNPLINKFLQNSLNEKSNLEIVIKEIKNRNEFIINEIEDYIKKSLVNVKKIEGVTHSKLESNKRALNNYKDSIILLNKEKEIILQFFDGLSIDVFEKSLKDEIETSKTKIKNLNNQIDKTKLKILEVNNVLNKISEETELLKSTINQEQKSDIIQSVNIFFEEKIKTNIINQLKLEAFLTETENQKLDLINKGNTLQKSLNDLNKILEKNIFSRDELETEIESISKLLSLNDKIIKNFENFILSDYRINLSKYSKEDAISQFENAKVELNKNIESKIEILKNYRIVESLKDKVYSFLETERNKENIIKIKKEIEILNDILKNLKIERKGLEEYLKETIDNFFYTNLINKIYSKIDPHPNNYKIVFDCEFNKEKNPRLQIYTIDYEGKKSVPSLYFSSAQINILSLSIFLARALKATNPLTHEKIECIFIDDPIQSMDSINILSFIDFFRSLSVNLNKQLIVSTHEENFHLLLQKKIPSKYFKSKFIQFETFGKLDYNVYA